MTSNLLNVSPGALFSFGLSNVLKIEENMITFCIKSVRFISLRVLEIQPLKNRSLSGSKKGF